MPDLDSFLKDPANQYQVKAAPLAQKATRSLDEFMAQEALPSIDTFMEKEKETFNPARSLVSGVGQIIKGAGGTMEALGSLTRFTPLGTAGIAGQLHEGGESLTKLVEPLMAPTMPFEEAVKSPEGAASWLVDTVLQQAPNLALSTGGFVAAKAAGMSGPVGAYITSLVQNAGETYTNLKDKGVSDEAAAAATGLVGPLKSILDTALPVRVGGKVVRWIRKDALEYAKKTGVVRELLTDALMEGATESGQELLDIAGEKPLGVYSGDGMTRILNSFMGGAVTGGAFGAAAHVAFPEPTEPKLDPTSPPPGLDPTLAEIPEPKVKVEEAPVGPQPKDVAIKSSADVMRERFLDQDKTRHPSLLFQDYTDERLRQVLKLPDEASIQPFVDEGFLTRNEQGLYRPTELVTGLRRNYIQPTSGDWSVDLVSGFAIYKYNRATEQYAATVERINVAGSDFFAVKAPDLGVVNSFQTEQAAREAVEAAWAKKNMRPGWELHGDLNSGGFYERPDPSGVLPLGVTKGPKASMYIAYTPSAVIGEYSSIDGALRGAEDFERWKNETHPFIHDVQFLPDDKRDNSQTLRRDMQKIFGIMAVEFDAAPEVVPGVKLIADLRTMKSPYVEKIRQEYLKAPHIKEYATMVKGFVDSAIKVLTADPELSKLRSIQLLPQVYQGVTMLMSSRFAGQWTGLGRAADRMTFSYNPFPLATMEDAQPSWAAEANWGTFVHELAHTVAIGHDPVHKEGTVPTTMSHTMALAKITTALLPMKAAYVARMMEIYGTGTGSNRISDRVLKAERRIRRTELGLDPDGPEISYSQGQEVGSTPKGPGDTGLAASGVGRTWESDESVRGTDPRAYFKSTESQYRGDYPGASQEYQDLVGAEFVKGGPEYTDNAPDPEADAFNASNKKALSHLPADQRHELMADTVKLGKYVRKWLTLIQIGKQNPGILPLQDYIESVRRFWITKTGVTFDADVVSRHWQKLSKELSAQLNDLLFTMMEKSFDAKKKFNETEVADIARQLGIKDEGVLKMFWEIDASTQRVLRKLLDAQIAEARRVYGDLADVIIWQKQKEYADMLDRNFFPATRFGKWAILVKAEKGFVHNGKKYRKGQRVEFSAWDFERDQKAAHKEISKRYASDPVKIEFRELKDYEAAFMSFTPSLFDLLSAKLNLTPQQVIQAKDIMYTLSPGQGFVKHLKQKHGIAGYSRDGIRAYNDYMQHASNHLARAVHGWEMQVSLKALEKMGKESTTGNEAGLLSETVHKHHADLMNPGDNWSNIRGMMYLWYMGFVPKQAIINMTQVPVFTMPFLIKNSGMPIGKADIMVAKELAKAYKDVTMHLLKPGKSPLSAEEMADFDRSYKEGFTDQSLATECAALAEQSTLNRYAGGIDIDRKFRQIREYSTWMFSVSEKYNRLVTFLAAVRMARARGLDAEGVFKFGREAVDTTQGEYSRWNRPEAFRGKKAVLFVFRSFLQNAVHFTVTGQGGARFILMMALFGGLKGIPFAEDLMNMLSLLGTTIKRATGWGNLKIDAERELRGFISDIGISPDFAMNGLGRESMGLTVLNWLFGLPVPNLDFSSSLQMGRIIPGVEPAAKALQGLTDFPTFFTRFTGEWIGASGSIGMNLMRMATENSSDSVLHAAKLMPSSIRNAARAYEYLTKEAYINAQGQPLVPFDVTKPQQMGEILGQLLGAQPTRVSETMEGMQGYREAVRYAVARREMILAEFATAVGGHSVEGIADSRKAVRKFNEEIEMPQLRIGAQELEDSITTRVRNQKLRERGLPTQKRYLELLKQYQSAFPSIQETQPSRTAPGQ